MLYMKEDDMDEMLRKAAENYEVDASKAADWNAIYIAVHTPDKTGSFEEKKKKRWFTFWWLLLIPLGWIANTEYNKFNTHKKSENIAPASIESKTNKPQQLSKESMPSDNNSNQKNRITKSHDQNESSLENNNHVKQYNEKKLADHNSLDNRNSLLQLQKPVEIQSEIEILAETENKDKENNPGIINPDQVNRKQTGGLPPLKKDTVLKQDNAVAPSKTSIKKEKKARGYFYTGLMAGADLSFVKYQSMQPVGYNVGLLAGYKFNKLSIESGLYFVKKNYYTDGEYFDKSDIPYFADAEILSVNGYCRMFEIPLNIRYDISEKKKHSWFVTAGVSSFLMDKEHYNYEYIKNGEWHNGSNSYYHSTQDWFSALNLSAGYQLKTGAKTSLRIEPYYKTSFNGIGTGSLSISSIGINAGLTRRIP